MTNNKTPTQTPDFKTMLSQLDKFLVLYLGQKAPSLPKNIREFIVKYFPYLIILLIIISAPAILFSFGLGGLVGPIAMMNGYRPGMSFSLVTLVLITVIILEIVAVPGLMTRKASAWKLLYYSTLLNSVYSLLYFNLGNLLIGTVVSLYILYQIKSYYQ